MSQTAVELSEEAGKCINCGFCEAVCPTFPSSGYDGSKGARGRVMLGKELVGLLGKGEAVELLSDPFFSCLDCYACYQVCPAGVNAGKVSHLAREILVERNQGVPGLARLLEKTTMRYRSILPIGGRASRWAEGLGIPSEGETLLYTGQMYQLMAYSGAITRFMNRRGRRMAGVIVGSALRFPWLMNFGLLLRDRRLLDEMNGCLRNIVQLLRRAGVNFSYMGSEEPYPGTLMFDLGFTDSMRSYAQFVTGEFRKRGVRRIITVDPHTHDILSNTYPTLVKDFDFEVRHYTELLGSLKFSKKTERVAFHEPCHLTRRFDDMTSPSDLLNKAAEVVLPDNSGKKTHCCGGPDELLYPSISFNVSRARLSQLKETGTDFTVTACPVCLLNMRGGNIIDLSRLLNEQISQ